MAFTSGGFHGLYYVLESSWGTTPLSPPMTALRHTECDINLVKGSFTSRELRSDRAIVDSRHGIRRVEGGFSFELSYEGFDDLLEGLMGGTWTSNVLKQGTTKRYFSMLRQFQDISQFMLFSGCAMASFGLEVTPEGMIEGNFGVMGYDMTPDLPTGLSYSGTAPTYSPMDSFTGTVNEGGSPIGTITAISMALENGITTVPVVGSNLVGGVVWGRSNLTGTVNVAFEDMTMFNKFVNETESSFDFTLSDGTRSLLFEMNRVKYNAANANVDSEEAVILDMPFQALHHNTDTNLKITRTPA